MAAVVPASMPQRHGPARGTSSASSCSHVPAAKSAARSVSDVPWFNRSAKNAGNNEASVVARSASVANRRGQDPASSRQRRDWPSATSVVRTGDRHARLRDTARRCRARRRAASRTSGPYPPAAFPTRSVDCAWHLTQAPSTARRDIRALVLGGHCAGSSASTNAGAKPCARRGSLPRHRTRAPVCRSSMLACCAVSQIRNRFGSWASHGRTNARMCSNATRACWKLDATITISPRRCTSGPSSAATATAATSVVLPLPRATLSAALETSSVNAPRRKRRCHDSTLNRWPANRPCVISNPCTKSSSGGVFMKFATWRSVSGPQRPHRSGVPTPPDSEGMRLLNCIRKR